MRLLFSVILGLLICGQLAAQDVETVLDSVPRRDTLDLALLTDVMENAVVYQDSLIEELMRDKRLGRQRGQQEAKNEALALQQELKNKLDYPVYVISEPPFWKVRIGDFLKREDANAYKETMLLQFPDLYGSTYIVPDKVIVLY